VVRGNRRIFRTHNQEFDALTEAERLAHATAAHDEKRRRTVTKDVQLSDLRRELAALERKQQLDEETSSGVQNTVASMRLSTESLDELARVWSTSKLPQRDLKESWAELLAPPAPPSPRLQAQLLEVEKKLSLDAELPDRASPWWVSVVAPRRDSFKNTALYFPEEDLDHAYFFLYAKLSIPVHIVCLKVRKQEVELPCFDREAEPSEPAGSAFEPWLSTFSPEQSPYVVSFDMPPAEDTQVFVYMGRGVPSAWPADQAGAQVARGLDHDFAEARAPCPSEEWRARTHCQNVQGDHRAATRPLPVDDG